MKMKKYIAQALLVTTGNLFFLHASADIRLPAIIGSHMVLQQKTAAKIWGWASPGEKISVVTSWDAATVQATGGSDGKWLLAVKTPVAGGPYTVTVKGNNTVVLDDVLIGEVWDCSGQSNMEMSFNWGINEYATDADNANNKQLHLFHVPRLTATSPQEDAKGSWVVCNTTDMKSFSLAGYFFGQQLQQVLKVPVGLIEASWGGTPAETWTPKEAIANDPVLQDASTKITPNDGWPSAPAVAYNAMIYPITNFSIAGVIWYQGEANTGGNATYQKLFTTMINSWRAAWQKNLPFYFVQIAPYSGYRDITGALLMEAQTKTLALPNTGMVVVHDLVTDVKNIHPHDKKDVGLRLANYALAETYGKKDIAYKSPMYKGMSVEKNKAVISFTDAGSGLVSKGDTLTEFYIAGDDKKFVPAMAVIKGSTVEVSSDAIAHPVAVRFGFTNTAMPNLFSKEGLPVNLFRTDNW